MNLEIYQEIKNRILFLKYQPGQFLNEKELADEFGVSKTPVREALLRLEWEKLVTIIPRAGIIVTKIEFQQLRDVFLIRVSIEGLIAKFAAIRINDTDLVQIRKLKDECKKITNTNKPEKLIGIDLKLRDIMNRSANSPILSEISDYLYCQTLRIWYLVFDQSNFSFEVEQQMKEIDITLESLSLGNPEKAEKIGRKIIINHMDRISKYFGSIE
jgi:DNA-binding GntR family transcriptional regulator